MKHKLILLLPIIFYITTYSQTIKISIHGLNDGEAYLFSLEGEKTFLLDSINISDDDSFKYTFVPRQNHSGFYRFSFNKNKFLDFIYDKEEIEIKTDTNNILDSIKIIKSQSNKIYYEIVKLNKEYKTKSELLQVILARYPKEDDFYQTTKVKLKQIQKDYLYFVKVTAQANPNSFIAKYVRSAQLSVIDVEIPYYNQLKYLKTHSLDNVNFYDNELIYSDVFTNKTIEYLTYYRNPQLPMDLLEKEFEAAIDTILKKAKSNDMVYKHIVEYLLDGFKKFEFDNVIDYIVKNYVINEEICLDEKLETTLERRIQQAKNFKVGTIVPNIIIPDSNGLFIDLNKINSDRTVIIFYASWCQHCQKLLPQIFELYKKQNEKRVEVLAISIDTSRSKWIKFIKQNHFDWLNVSDLMGWNGGTTQDYFIYATPTIFLVNQNKKLLKLASSLEDLTEFFRKLVE